MWLYVAEKNWTKQIFIAKAAAFSFKSDKSPWRRSHPHWFWLPALKKNIAKTYLILHQKNYFKKKVPQKKNGKKMYAFSTKNRKMFSNMKVINRFDDYGWSLVALGSSLIALHWALAFLPASSPVARFFTAYRFPTDFLETNHLQIVFLKRRSRNLFRIQSGWKLLNQFIFAPFAPKYLFTFITFTWNFTS